MRVGLPQCVRVQGGQADGRERPERPLESPSVPLGLHTQTTDSAVCSGHLFPPERAFVG